jgi:hypothetical protein
MDKPLAGIGKDHFESTAILLQSVVASLRLDAASASASDWNACLVLCRLSERESFFPWMFANLNYNSNVVCACVAGSGMLKVHGTLTAFELSAGDVVGWNVGMGAETPILTLPSSRQLEDGPFVVVFGLNLNEIRAAATAVTTHFGKDYAMKGALEMIGGKLAKGVGKSKGISKGGQGKGDGKGKGKAEGKKGGAPAPPQQGVVRRAPVGASPKRTAQRAK